MDSHLHINDSEVKKEIENGYRVRPVSKKNAQKEIEKITFLGIRRYGKYADYLKRFNANMRWYKKRKDIFLVITCKDEIIGYLCMIPLMDQPGTFGKEHYYGRCDEFDITDDMIAPQKTTHIFYQSSSVEPIHFPGVMGVKMNNFYKKIASFMYNEPNFISQTIIYAESMLKDHVMVLREMGFTISTEQNDANKEFYEINFNEHSNTHKKKRGINAIIKIHGYIK